MKQRIQTVGWLKRAEISAIKNEVMFHRAQISMARKTCGPITREFIQDLDDEWILDVRLHRLKKKELPAIGTWHLDFYEPDASGKEAEIRMAIVGDCSRTEVITSDLKVDAIEWVSDLKNVKFKSRKIKEFEIVSIGGHTYHRATPANRKGCRLFMRAIKRRGYLSENRTPSTFIVWHKKHHNGLKPLATRHWNG